MSAEVKGWSKLYEITKQGMSSRRVKGQMFTVSEVLNLVCSFLFNYFILIFPDERLHQIT
jgi:hypothetical protein